jgi:Mg-chelatase subunit ChlD
MSFVTALALALSLLVAVPTLAHLLRRGRAREQAFPPAALVPEARATTRERSRLEDRGLLALRALAVLCLALIGAGPLVQCSRVAVGRIGGASVAIALVIDDSASMRAVLESGPTRFERARAAAEELLASARDGDAVALVMAGKPARLALAAGTDLGTARKALAQLGPSDRATDLRGAIELARAAIAALPHADKRVVLLSDLASELPDPADKNLWAPLPELAVAIDDCGITSASLSGKRISAEVACTSEAAARGRALRLAGAAGASIPEARLIVRPGAQLLALDADAPKTVELTGTDQNPSNDRAEVAQSARAATIAVHADPTKDSVATGGPPLLEQALGALSLGAALRPLPELPRESAELAGVAALLIDDPVGLTPETRGALDQWLESGAVAAIFLGERARSTPLGSTLEPFVSGAVEWEPLAGQSGADPASLSWLGVEGGSLNDLGAKGRARLDTALVPGAAVIGRWNDGKVLIARQERGRGLLFSVGLPVDVQTSDLPLRPGFLALLDHIVSEGLRRRGPQASEAGSEWWFAAGPTLSIEGPSGALAVREADSQRVATPELAGRYQIKLGGKPETRFATLAPQEILTAPQRDLPATWRSAGSAGPPQVDASPELGWALLGLLGVELLVRGFRLFRERRPRDAIQPST